jgi:molecular chaperone DnaK (HSP70)
MPRYLIGIDLGTTNSALAYTEAQNRTQPVLSVFDLPQLVAPGDMAPRELLPSFLYLAGPDLPPGACAVPWDAQRTYAVGEFARLQGAKVPGRLVSSAKSWLCHAGVDRHAALLPWGAPPEVTKVSPVEASARYLKHMAEAWNYEKAKGRTDFLLEEQEIVLTVPASFDDVARSLTAEAAQKAGFKHLTLLEEPQAAFYSWLSHATRTTHRLEGLLPGMTCLVVDVGGGTTDFSLIQSGEEAGQLSFARQAVGDHLLLGGDNMDLALAKAVEAKLPQAGRLDAARFASLSQACRAAKETLLAPQPPAEYTVTVMGRGRSVVGGALHTSLTPQEVRQILFDGFLPLTPFTTDPERGGRTGLNDLGLPFVSDPAITHHLAAFLRQHGLRQDKPPDAILFNGGVFQAKVMQNRLLEVMHTWFDQPGKPWQPIVLASASLDLAVALGAAYYGWLRFTGGKRISGGLARSYYLGIATEEDKETRRQGDREKEPLDVLCVVPQHLEEGQEVSLQEPVLELALGQPVQFPLYTSTARSTDKAGELLQLEPKHLLKLSPLQTVLRGGKRSGTKGVPVTLAAKLTEIGTLELHLVAQNSPNRWRLEFNTRAVVTQEDTEGEDAAPVVTDVWPEEKVQAAIKVMRDTYSTNHERAAEELTKAWENVLEASRHDWPTGLCRRLVEVLLEVAEERRRSPAHLRRWYHLVGYCLRPGFGDPKDRFRVEQVWKLLTSPVRQQAGTGLVTTKVQEGGADYWILWRRVSGGLSNALQLALMDRLRPLLLGSKGGKAPLAFRPAANELAEMWRAAASFERLDLRLKEQLGETLLKQLRKPPTPTYLFWSLTRLGSRVLFYGPLNAVLHPQTVEPWLEQLLAYQPQHESDRHVWLFCLAQLSRRTNQRLLDIDDDLRARVVALLEREKAPAHLITLVQEGGALESAEQKQFLGEGLPLGLRLNVRSGE